MPYLISSETIYQGNYLEDKPIFKEITMKSYSNKFSTPPFAG